MRSRVRLALAWIGIQAFFPAAFAHATTVIHQDTRALVRGSSDIVVGRVASARSFFDVQRKHIFTEVTFEVRLDHTWGSELLSGTWVCVNEGGEWKLDRLENERTVPA